ncbi:hypothetical protein D3C71_1483200 [compost metagenome]
MQHAQAGLLDLVGEPPAQIDLPVDRPASARQPGQEHPTQQGGHQHRQQQQERAGRQRQQQVGEEGVWPGHAVAHQVQPARVDPIDQHEAGKDRHEKQRRDQRAAQGVGHHVQPAQAPCAHGAGRQIGGMRLRVVPGGRARPDLSGRHTRAGCQRRQAVQPRALAHRHIALQHRVRADIGVVRQRDRPHLPDAAAHREILQVDRRADTDAVADRQQIRRADRDAADGGVAADARPQR